MTTVLDVVKGHALSFHRDVVKSLEQKGKSIDSIRIRAIAFRDFLANPKTALEESELFRLPDPEDVFSDFVFRLEAKGGGDNGGESAFGALGPAMQFRWMTPGDRRRPVGVLWTAAPAPFPERLRAWARAIPRGCQRTSADSPTCSRAGHDVAFRETAFSPCSEGGAVHHDPKLMERRHPLSIDRGGGAGQARVCRHRPRHREQHLGSSRHDKLEA